MQTLIDKILGMDRQQKTDKDIEAVKQYSFSSFTQFKAVIGTRKTGTSSSSKEAESKRKFLWQRLKPCSRKAIRIRHAIAS